VVIVRFFEHTDAMAAINSFLIHKLSFDLATDWENTFTITIHSQADTFIKRILNNRNLRFEVVE